MTEEGLVALAAKDASGLDAQVTPPLRTLPPLRAGADERRHGG